MPPLKNRRGMSTHDINEQWLPIQIAPDDCDLELGRPYKMGIVPWTFPARRKSGVWDTRSSAQTLNQTPNVLRAGKFQGTRPLL